MEPLNKKDYVSSRSKPQEKFFKDNLLSHFFPNSEKVIDIDCRSFRCKDTGKLIKPDHVGYNLYWQELLIVEIKSNASWKESIAQVKTYCDVIKRNLRLYLESAKLKEYGIDSKDVSGIYGFIYCGGLPNKEIIELARGLNIEFLIDHPCHWNIDW